MKFFVCLSYFLCCTLFLKAQNIEDFSYMELDSIRRDYHQKGDYEMALLYANRCVDQIKSTAAGDSILAVGLRNLGRAYASLGVNKTAEPLFLRATEITKKLHGEEHEEYATCLNALAILYEDMGKYEDAKSLHLQIINIRKELLGEEHPSYGISLNNLASLYYVMEKHAEALPLFVQSSAIWKKALGEQHVYYTISLNNLAALYQLMGKYKEAEELYLKAIKIRKVVLGETHPDYTISLNNLAAVYQDMERYEEAKVLFLKARDVRKATLGDKHPYTVQSLNNLAGLYGLMGDYEMAKTTFCAALQANAFTKDVLTTAHLLKLTDYEYGSINQAITSIEGFTRLYRNKYESLGDAEDLIKCQEAYNAAIAIHHKIRNEFNAENDKLRTLSRISSLVGGALDNNVQILKVIPSNKEAALIAFRNAEENKSILLAEAIKGERARAMGDLPDSLVQQELNLQEAVSNLKRAKVGANTEEARKAISEQENKLTFEVNRFKKLLKDKYPKYHNLKYENIAAKAADIQDLLDDKTLLLEYFVADTACYLFAISKNEVNLYPIPIKKKTLKSEIKIFRKALSDYQFILRDKSKAYELYARKGFWFYNNLLKVALEGNAVKHLIIIADGELGHLPFEAFLTKNASQSKNEYKDLSYLINQYNISYDYSATLWKENRTRKTDNAPNFLGKGKMLACAAAYPNLGEENASPVNLSRGPRLISLRNQLDALPKAEEEIKLLAQRFEGEFWLNEQSNEAAFKQSAQNYGILHLAMHGILDKRAPILSSLAFTENQDSTEDNFLQAYEISQLHLNADLVVLSACETGYGKFEQGEGVLSLARSFMYAGVPSLVVSLWQVNDASTALIMEPFYENLAKGLPKDEALRLAKLNYLQKASGVTAHPAFWSSFIQLGDSRPIELLAKRNNNNLLYLLGLGGLLLLIVVFIFKRKREA